MSKDYKFRDDLVKSLTDTCPIEIMWGPFEGIIFRYDQVHIKENEDRTSATMNFQYTIIDKKDFDEEKLRKSPEFHTLLGALLNQIIISNVELNDNDDTETGKSDIQESTEDGTVPEEGAAVSQA